LNLRESRKIDGVYGNRFERWKKAVRHVYRQDAKNAKVGEKIDSRVFVKPESEQSEDWDAFAQRFMLISHASLRFA
jgi:hypothetical protein